MQHKIQILKKILRNWWTDISHGVIIAFVEKQRRITMTQNAPTTFNAIVERIRTQKTMLLPAVAISAFALVGYAAADRQAGGEDLRFRRPESPSPFPRATKRRCVRARGWPIALASPS